MLFLMNFHLVRSICYMPFHNKGLALLNFTLKNNNILIIRSFLLKNISNHLTNFPKANLQKPDIH